jgi:protocatechuate 3,4-dioxygenase beta subunit
MRLMPRFPKLTSDHAPLAETMRVLAERRRVLRTMLGAGAMLLASKAALACELIPEETSGPYPGDGTNGPNVLTEDGIVRDDIRSSFGTASATAAGTLAIVTLDLVSTLDACGPIEGLVVYLWHCDADGRYSMYSQDIADENYLRGVQLTDSNGRVTFTSIFPACYSGRWPHIHFEIYASLDAAVNGRNAIRTSQLALPQATCDDVYAQTDLYPASAGNLARTSLAGDMVFGDDDAEYQLATVTGNNDDGYVVSLEVGVAASATNADPVFADGFEPA